MKVKTPEISWHGRDPVYSVDFQYLDGDITRIASCGADQLVRVWKVVHDSGKSPTVEFLATLTRHNRTVNVVRFSPDGQLLASAGDDSVILLWRQNDTPPPSVNIFQGDEDEDNKENWTVAKSLRSHLEDVYDISWSSDGKYLISGSVDNSAIMWDAKKGSRITIMPDHKGYVQGVAFDPLNQYLATMSADRCCRIFSISSKNCVYNIKKLAPSGDKMSSESSKPVTMFHDDTMKSFYRRLAFSPDGQLLVTPAGHLEQNGDAKALYTTYVFTRYSFPKPVLHLPAAKKVTICTRFSPVLYELRKIPRENTDKENTESDSNREPEEWEKYQTTFCLPYRMIFAVATEDAVLLYDTQQPHPFGYVAHTHYHTLSDLAWSRDGNLLIVSSTDGYCSIISFSDGELGKPYKDQVVKITHVNDVKVTDAKPTKSSKSKQDDSAGQKPDITEQNAKNKAQNGEKVRPVSSSATSSKPSGARRIQVTTLSTSDSEKEACKSSTEAVLSSAPQSSSQSQPSSAPRRIQVTTLTTLDSKPSAAKSESTSTAASSQQSTTPRRVKVTTLKTYSEENTSNKRLRGKGKPHDEDNQSESKSEEADEDLHLVLDTDTMDTDDVQTCDNQSTKTVEKSSSEKSVPRRIQVTTIETFNS